MTVAFDPALALAVTIGSAMGTAILIRALRPWLARYALARPNARSSHTIPTPQGGGMAIVAAVAAVAIATAAGEPWGGSLLAALVALAVAGALDDIRPLPVLPRLLLQLATAALVVHALPASGRVLPMIPAPLESVALVVGLVWFINLTNFMDGIDWMTVVEVVPISATLALAGMLGLVPELAQMLPIILALLGAMIGFAPFNRHVAKLFMGDVGSLPIGLLVGWLLYVLAGAGHLVAAAILPLYYVADATITLLRRWSRGEKLSQAHRSHFYQLAVVRGLTVPEVTRRVLLLNIVLAVLALASILAARPVYSAVCLAAAMLATAVLLRGLERGRTA